VLSDRALDPLNGTGEVVLCRFDRLNGTTRLGQVLLALGYVLRCCRDRPP